MSSAAWREFQRGTALINQAKDYARMYADATEEDTLTALGEPATENNRMYAGTGLFLAAREREGAVVAAGGQLTQARLAAGRKPKEDIMRDIDPGTLTWCKSSASAAGACVEVAHLPGGAGVALRDSKDPSGEPHWFTPDERAAFVTGVKAGEFDLPST